MSVTGYRVATFYRIGFNQEGKNARLKSFHTRADADTALNAEFTGRDYRRELHEILDDSRIGRRLAVVSRPRV